MVPGSSSDTGVTPSTPRILVSACLLGEAVRYDGGHLLSTHPLFQQWHAEGKIVQVCPEVAGGLPVPRAAAETQGGDGTAVWSGSARVIARDGEDVTDAFLAGAKHALALAHRRNCRLAVLAAKSPSCGNREIYDGSFSGQLVAGQGTAAAHLEAAGIRVFNQYELDAADQYLRSLT